MYERTRYGTTLHFQKVVQGSDAYLGVTDIVSQLMSMAQKK
jgi:hypothetical protein